MSSQKKSAYLMKIAAHNMLLTNAMTG